jgi:hypothetical protein
LYVVELDVGDAAHDMGTAVALQEEEAVDG